MPDEDLTNATTPKFDFSAFPLDTCFHERRTGADRRKKNVPDLPAAPRRRLSDSDRAARKERRKRVDPTTFEKQYSDDEIEFMNAMQRFKVNTGKTFPSYRDVLQVAIRLGYGKSDSSALLEALPIEGDETDPNFDTNLTDDDMVIPIDARDPTDTRPPAG